MRVSTCAGSVAALALLVGCATTVPQESAVVRADLAIDQATTEEAAQYAPAALQEAQQKLERARAAAYAGNQQATQQLAEQALASAQLAIARSQRARAERLVQENLQTVESRQQQRTEVTR